MKIVCDTNVLLSGLIWQGTPGRIWDRVETGADRLAISRDLLAELGRVLAYPRIARALARRGLRPADLLAAVSREADLLWPRPVPFSAVPADPDDTIVLACAEAAGADFVITGDAHLLALRRWNGIRIATPAGYLAAVAGGAVRERRVAYRVRHRPQSISTSP